ncbi:MAG: hypothetical protein IJU33_06630 [Bacteroidales bacterium]|nr:hypothetical protein [Bacteroidales bacterium]
MKRILATIFLLIVATAVMAQAPQQFTYQSVVRDNSNNLLKNTDVMVTISLLQGGESSDAVYVETHHAQTNANGLMTLLIGGGTVTSGSFSDIDWGSGPYFVRVETNLGDKGTLTTVQQLLSVPYAQYANATGNYTETDPSVSAWAKEANKPVYDYSEIQNTPTIPTLPDLAAVATSGNYNDLQNRPQIPQIPANVSAFNNDKGYLTTETDPTISAWAKEANKPVYDYSEIQNTPTIPTVPDLAAVATSGNYNDLSNTPTIPTVPTNVGAFTNDKGYLTTETDPTISAWAKAATKPTYNYSEIKNTPTLSTVATSGNYNDLQNRPQIPQIPANVSAFNNDKGYLTTETDPTISAWAKAATKPTYNYSEIKNTPTLSTVATSGNYNDLQNRPQIPQIPTDVSAFNNDKGYLTTETDPTISAWAKEANKPVYDYSEIQNTPTIPTVPDLAAVATSGNYNDLSNTPTIPTVPTKLSELNNDMGFLTEADVQEAANIPTKVSAFENDAHYLTSYTETDPTISAWAKEANKPVYDYSEIQNTPTLSTVATSGSYNDLQNRPQIPQIPADVSAFNNDKGYLTSETDPTISAWAKAATKPTYNYSEIKNTPTLSTVATSGNYNDLQNRPQIPQIPADVSAFNNDKGYLTTETDPTISAWAKEANKPVYDYSEIQNTPTIPTVPDLAAVATSGNYNDLQNRPQIPQIPADVSAFNNDKGYLTTETDPTISAWAKAATKPTYNYSEIQNTPTIPTVPTNVSAFTNDKGYLVSADLQTIQADIASLNALRTELNEMKDSIRDLKQSLSTLSELVNTLNINMEQETFSTTAGQTTFTLQHEPSPTGIIRCYINGVMAGSDRNGVLNIDNNNHKQIHYTATNNHGYALKANDKVTFVYWY